ncbi:Bacteriocin class II with double-glycine leader peptide [Streptococcus criceti]|uniref:Bacteriocin class II with double-glycine leader peptide n=1 Tax=Streptococcus criceti HS-6 TaxID=873449 RepID=G5JMJ7_STRCG|nr:Blp family class II bacteriocin [Streptococcus criceti]EHI74103.1 hypothetical protein STRCR_1259 [Streptococcus criceti HS-6]SUN38643.1 Bacteriocin class II with double-glycine leader peptide [Streptococcus criceti]
MIKTLAFEQFEAVDNETLAIVKGGLSDCAQGTLATAALGAATGGGPWGAVGGGLVGVAAFCLW